MKIVNIFIKIEDVSTGCLNTKIVSRSYSTYLKMLPHVGKTLKKFDKGSQVSFVWEIKEVRIAEQQDYKNTQLEILN